MASLRGSLWRNLLAIGLASLSVALSCPGKIRTAYRHYAENGRQYLIEYVYATNAIEAQRLELSDPKAEPKIHFDAEITVFDITGGRRVRVGEPMDGVYTELGCIEDAPALLVHQAMGRAERERLMSEGSAQTSYRHLIKSFGSSDLSSQPSRRESPTDRN